MKLEETVVWNHLRQQEKAGRKRSALITDIDNTFYRADHEGAVQAAWDLRKKATAAPYPIIAVTGNGFEVVQQRLQNELPGFEVIIGSVGTEIWFLLPDGTFKKDDVYEKQLQALGYDRKSIVQSASQLIKSMSKKGAEIDFQDHTKEVAYLENPSPEYLPYKVSLHFFAEDPEDIGETFEREFSNHKIVVCEEIHYNATLSPNERRKKYCLDIMAATKSDAANYIIKRLDLEQGVVAGDSGNDIDMLLETPGSFVAVAVGGHKSELGVALEKYAPKRTTGVSYIGQKPVFIDKTERRAAQTLLLLHDYLGGGDLVL